MEIEIKEGQLCNFFCATMSLKGAQEQRFSIQSLVSTPSIIHPPVISILSYSHTSSYSQSLGGNYLSPVIITNSLIYNYLCFGLFDFSEISPNTLGYKLPLLTITSLVIINVRAEVAISIQTASVTMKLPKQKLIDPNYQSSHGSAKNSPDHSQSPHRGLDLIYDMAVQDTTFLRVNLFSSSMFQI